MRLTVLALAVLPIAAHAQSTTVPAPSEPHAQAQTCPVGMSWDAAAGTCAVVRESGLPANGPSGCSHGATREIMS